jgi:hypothetical protein
MAALLAGMSGCLGSVDRVYESADGGAATPSDATTESSVAPDAPTLDVAQPGDSGTVADATFDVVVTPDAGVEPDAAPDAGAGQTYQCGTQTVTSCSSCTGTTLDCVYCGAGDTHPGVCGAPNMYCSSSAPNGAAVCNCPGNDLGSCVAPFQVCTNIAGTFYCQSCGEMGSDMKPCKGGGTCNQATKTCG